MEVFEMKLTVNSPKAPAAIGPYCHAKLVSGVLYTSGQLGLTAEGVLPAGIEAQTKQSLENIGHVLAAAGLHYQDVIKTTIFLADMNDFAAVNEIYAQVFPKDPPARSCVAVKTLPKNALIEIEVIAAR